MADHSLALDDCAEEEDRGRTEERFEEYDSIWNDKTSLIFAGEVTPQFFGLCDLLAAELRAVERNPEKPRGARASGPIGNGKVGPGGKTGLPAEPRSGSIEGRSGTAADGRAGQVARRLEDHGEGVVPDVGESGQPGTEGRSDEAVEP